MLVLAAPRPPDSQEVESKMDVTITESILELSCTQILQQDPLYDPTTIITTPHGAPAARARHREKVRSYILELIFQTKPASKTK